MKNPENSKYTVYAVLLSLLSSAAIWAQNEMTQHDPLLLGAVIALFACYTAAFRCGERSAGIYISGFMFALFMVLGKLSALQDARNPAVWILIRFFGFWAMFTAILTVVFHRLASVELIDFTATSRSARQCRLVFLAVFLFISAVYSLWWLYEYPGNTSADSNVQLMQAMGLFALRSDHPAVSTLFLKLIYVPALSLFNGNQNAALALYTAVQSLIMAAIYAYVAESVYEFGCKKGIVISIVILYALHPIYGSYSITVTKDVLFSGFLTSFGTTLWRIIRKYKYMGRKAKVWEIILLYLSGLLAGLFRNHTHYAFLLLFPFFFLVFRKRNRFVQFMPAVVFLLALLITGPLYSALHIGYMDVVESVSIPVQHISRVICDGNTLTDEQIQLLSKVVDMDRVKETYNPMVSDPMKVLIRKTGDVKYLASHKSEYLRLWLELGRQHPMSYLNAQIDQTKGYWYPDLMIWTLCNDCAPTGENTKFKELAIYKDRRLPAPLSALLEEIVFLMQTRPLIGLLFNMALAVWLTIALFFFCIYRRKKEELLIFIPSLALILTLLAVSPTFIEVRYVLPVFATLPLLCVVPFCGGIGQNQRMK